MEDNEVSSLSWLELTERFINTCYQAKDILNGGSWEEKRDLVKVVSENLILKDGKLNVTLKKPFDVMLQPALRTNWLASWELVGTFMVSKGGYILNQ